MEHISLEVFDRTGTGSQYATLPDDTTITIIDTSEIFASGDVWSYDFTLNIYANAHIFGTSGDLHGSRLHEQVNKRRARLWVEGLPLYLGYLKLDDEVEVNANGDVDVKFWSGQKTFEDMIEGTSAQAVSVGDVQIGVALNRKRVVSGPVVREYDIVLDGLKAYTANDEDFVGVENTVFKFFPNNETDESGAYINHEHPYMQRWPKIVKSHGTKYRRNESGILVRDENDYTNIQTPYDGTPTHSFCNINICYPFKANDNGDEVAGRGYTLRLAHGDATTDGGDNQTRYNNAPNFYLLYFIDRLMKDMGIKITENQAMDVEDLRRVFMLNYGCNYEEIENDGNYFDNNSHTTPADKIERYGQYYLPLIGDLVKDWSHASMLIPREDNAGKILLKNVVLKNSNGKEIHIGSIEGNVKSCSLINNPFIVNPEGEESSYGFYSSYVAYATGENYPNVEISKIIDAMKSMFGVRFLFNDDYSTVRIVLLRNIFKNTEVQDINCEILDEDEKTESNKRGFRMTYGKGTDDTNYYYKGFNDKLPHKDTIWKDTTDKHDYSQWRLNEEYDKVKHTVSAFDKTCYVTPVNGNAYGIKVDENEDVLFPVVIEYAAFMDAEDGDCAGDAETIEEVQIGASPVIMNDVNGAYASLFGGDMNAPTPDAPSDLDPSNTEHPSIGQKIATFGMVEQNEDAVFNGVYEVTRLPQEPLYYPYSITGKADIYISEGFQIRLKDNYAVSNGGTPFDEADPGLQFGIMRSSGSDAYILYANDTDEKESPINDYWEVVPGNGAIDHADTCDPYGKLWDYDGSILVNDRGTAIEQMQRLWPNGNINVVYSSVGVLRNIGNYILNAVFYEMNWKGSKVLLLFAATLGNNAQVNLFKKNGVQVRPSAYCAKLNECETIQAMFDFDADTAHDGLGALIEVAVDKSSEWMSQRRDTLLALQRRAFVLNDDTAEPFILDDSGVGSLYGRFSLKLRAEKPNPYYDPSQPEGPDNRRYLEITNPNLRQRGIADQLYKEYSYWIRNSRIVKRPVRMELAQLLAIDKTKRVRVGDVMGFIRKMKYTVNNKTGLGNVTMEIMYI